jgi:hypothetical protein
MAEISVVFSRAIPLHVDSSYPPGYLWTENMDTSIDFVGPCQLILLMARIRSSTGGWL